MSKAEDKTTVLARRKNIQLLIDYCLDQKIVFTVSPRAISNEEFEVEMEIGSIRQAIAVGIFVKENKFDVFGLGDFVKPKAPQPNKKSDAKEPAAGSKENTKAASVEDTATLNFGLNVNSN
jgi:hypothetical protein